MIKQQKGMSNLLVGIIGMVLVLVLFTSFIVDKSDIGASNVANKLNISKHLPTFLTGENKPVLDKDLTDYTFDVISTLISENYKDNLPKNHLDKGAFILVPREIFDDSFLIGFYKGVVDYASYVRPNSNILNSKDLAELKKAGQSLTYYQNDVFTGDDLNSIVLGLEDKKFVVMPRDKNNEDAAYFLHQVTGMNLVDGLDKENDESNSFENLLKRNEVTELSFSSGKISKLNFYDFNQKEQSVPITSSDEESFLVYRYEDYIVFFPLGKDNLHLGLWGKNTVDFDTSNRILNEVSPESYRSWFDISGYGYFDYSVISQLKYYLNMVNK